MSYEDYEWIMWANCDTQQDASSLRRQVEAQDALEAF